MENEMWKVNAGFVPKAFAVPMRDLFDFGSYRIIVSEDGQSFSVSSPWTPVCSPSDSDISPHGIRAVRAD